MCRLWKFCQRGSNFDNFTEGFILSWQIPLEIGHHLPASETPFKWRCDFSMEATDIAKKPYSFVILLRNPTALCCFRRGLGGHSAPHSLAPHISKCFGTSLIGEQQILRRAFTNDWSHQNICGPIPDKKKKRTTTFFPLRSPFNTKMLIVMKYSFLIKFN